MKATSSSENDYRILYRHMPEEFVCYTVYFRNFKVPNIRNYNEFEFRFVLDRIMCGLQSVPVIDFIGFLSSLV
jgi:hypothetical protein